MINELQTIKKGTVFYSDVPASFAKSLISNDLTASYDLKAVQESMAAIIMTNKGERPFEPEYGCNVSNQLFELMSNTTAYAMRNDILYAIKNYEPRVILKNVVVVPDYDNNRYALTIEYHLNTDYYTIFETKMNLKRSQTNG